MNVDDSNVRMFTSAWQKKRTVPLNMLTIMITVIFSVGMLVPFCAAQPAVPPLTVRGGLLTIKGDIDVIRGIVGVLRHPRVDKETQKGRLIVPGEKIEVQVSSEGRALSIKPSH